MKRMKVILEQTMLVSFLVLCAVSLYGLFVMKKNEWCFDWYTPGSIVVASLMCSIVTVLMLYNEWYNTASALKQGIITLILLILIYVIIMVFGHISHWYTTTSGFIRISIIFVVVYAGAWVGTGIMFRHDEKLISDALDNVRDKE